MDNDQTFSPFVRGSICEHLLEDSYPPFILTPVFVAVFLGCTSTGKGGFMLFVVLCPGTPEGSTGSGSGFKASQKTGQRLKVSSDRLGEAGNRTCDSWFTRHRRYFQHELRL